MRTLCGTIIAAAMLCGCASQHRGGYALEHTAIDVANPVATAAWWVENLGFEITSQRDDVTHTTFIVDRTGRIALELYRAKDASAAPTFSIRSLRSSATCRAKSV